MKTVTEKHCPLCGKANRCAMAEPCKGQQKTSMHCWCTELNVPVQLQKRIPATAQLKSCICRECINAQQSSQ